MESPTETAKRVAHFNNDRLAFRLMIQDKMLNARKKLEDRAYGNKRLTDATAKLERWHRELDLRDQP